VVVEKDRVDQVDRSCNNWNIT